MKVLLFFLIASLFKLSLATVDCQLLAPTRQSEDQIGFIFFPGAYIRGESYVQILAAIQASYPGSVWAGATFNWSGNLVNPVQADAAVQACLEKANAAGYNTKTLFFGGHSLGGIVLQDYISSNLDLATGLLFFGSWLNDETNKYPIPTLGLTGTIDGLSLSQFAVEVKETMQLSEEEQNYTFSVMVDSVNHAQVASIEDIPEDVIQDDIDEEVSYVEAHLRYADITSIFMTYLAGNPSDSDSALQKLVKLRNEAIEFFQPFYAMEDLERKGTKSPWVETAQLKLLGKEEENAVDNGLVVQDTTLASTSDFQNNVPTFEQDTAKVLSHFQHKVIGFDISALTIKAKMKAANSVLENMGLNPLPSIVECSSINSLALQTALDLTSAPSLARYQSKGRKLIFGPDIDQDWISNWESELGLIYTRIPGGIPETVELKSYRLLSNETFVPPGMNYCDLFSPYRAIEWIYINSLKHGYYV